jgi:hypothetical protein
MADDERYQLARKRASELRKFYTMVGTFVILAPLLFAVDLLTGDGWWFFWPLLGFAIATAFSAFRLFVQEGRLGADWEERKTRELMDREQRQ